jgi:hypothetical protein
VTAAKRCNCETQNCEDLGNHQAGNCDRTPSGRYQMDWLGDVCDRCAEATIANGGASYIHERSA